MKALAADANEVQKIAGHEVFSFEEKLEKDLWTILFVQPKPNMLVCATDQVYLTEVLNRMNRRGDKRALPDDLPEWKHVDTSARCWGLRHYGRPPNMRDADSPLLDDPQAVGFCFFLYSQQTTR